MKNKTNNRANSRLCLKCSIEKPLSDFYEKGGNTCKNCAGIQARVRYKEKFIQYSAARKNYREKNKERIRNSAAAYQKKTNHAAYSNEKNKQYRIKITDGYAKRRLKSKGVDVSNITAHDIEIAKSKILLERIQKQLMKSGVRICKGCKKKKTVDEFYKKKFFWKGVEKLGLDNYCKPCSNKRSYSYQKK